MSIKLPLWFRKLLNPNLVGDWGDKELHHVALSPSGAQEYKDTRDLRDWLGKNKCPDCHQTGFYSGPEGGMSQNIMCANSLCCSAFNVASFGGGIISAERISNQYWSPPIRKDSKGQVVKAPA